jgi:branched-chain amino acid transport system ATP-binding protein
MILRLNNISVGYGHFIAASDISLSVEQGSILALIGPNGAGKTSLIMSIAGHVEVKQGDIFFEEQVITSMPSYNRIKLGLSIVPEGRKLFTDLTVKENLIIGNYSFPRKYEKERMEFVFDLFPRLKERLNQLADTLSGGEQQMLAIGRALMSNPKFLMIDEMSLGLMPKAVNQCYEAIKKLKESGMSLLIVEQNTAKALDIADYVTVVESGKKVWEGTAEEAKNDSSLIDAFMGIKNE